MTTEEQTLEQEEATIEAAIQNANNFGPAVDMFHPDYGQILKDGQPTPDGLRFFEEKLEPYLTSKQGGKA